MQHAPHHTHHPSLTNARILAIDLLRTGAHHLIALTVLVLLALLITVMAQGGWFEDHRTQSPSHPTTPSVLGTP